MMLSMDRTVLFLVLFVSSALFMVTAISSNDVSISSSSRNNNDKIVSKNSRWGSFRCDIHSDMNTNSGDNAVREPVAVHFDIQEVGKEDRGMCVYYKELSNWRLIVSQLVEKADVEGDSYHQDTVMATTTVITAHIEERLQEMGYPPEYVRGEDAGNEQTTNSQIVSEFLPPNGKHSDVAIKQILETMYKADRSNTNIKHDIKTSGIVLKGSRIEDKTPKEVEVLSAEKKLDVMALNATASIAPDLFVVNAKSASMTMAASNPVSTTRNILQRYTSHKSYDVGIPAAAEGNVGNVGNVPPKESCPVEKKPESMFIIYQTRFARTGGTVALDMLHEHLRDLIGENALLCNENNHMSSLCANPPEHAVVVTGEWCHEVLEDHGIANGHFRGRGIQYHLGFHYDNDICSGHIAMTDSQYLATYLHTRVLNAYFLGCPMTKKVTDHFAGMLMTTKSSGIAKENLIVIDPDFGDDYMPLKSVSYGLPTGVRGVIAKGIPHDDMPLLLHRAKVILDLALPGPERLSGEGALFGAIPIISSRWNGASEIDFPGVLRVDALNGTAISEMIAHAFSNYDDIIKSKRNSEFVSYIMSLDDRLQNTLNVVTKSSSMHFLLKPMNLEEEKNAVYLVMAISYLFPLASINVYVKDVMWFLRQHYPLLNILKNGGLSRDDPFLPEKHARLNLEGFSHVEFLSHEQMLDSMAVEEDGIDIKNMLPPWAVTPILLSVKCGTATIFGNAHQLLNSMALRSESTPGVSLEIHVSQRSRPFASIFPYSIYYDCSEDEQKQDFLRAVEVFFAEELQEKSSAQERIILSTNSVRAVSSLMECSTNHQNSDVFGSLRDIIDGLSETAAFQTLQTYYCNIRQ